jgi:hypothetical protein
LLRGAARKNRRRGHHDLNLASQMHRRIDVVDGRVVKDERLTASVAVV